MFTLLFIAMCFSMVIAFILIRRLQEKPWTQHGILKGSQDGLTSSAPKVGLWAFLGVVTSIPEMVSFFAVYATAAREGRLQDLNDTQEALDNFTGSNMANVGVVYPVGLLAFLLGSSFLGGG